MPKRLSNSELLRRNEMFNNGMVLCSRCKTFKPFSDFWEWNTKPQVNYGYRCYCKSCEAGRRDKEAAKRRYTETRKTIDKIANLTGGKCQYPGCNYTDLLSLEYHHVNPAEKAGLVNQIALVKSKYNDAIIEADKCCLLCPNHHKEIENGIYSAKFVKRDTGLGYTIDEVTILEDRLIVKRGRPNNIRTTSAGISLYLKQEYTQLELG